MKKIALKNNQELAGCQPEFALPYEGDLSRTTTKFSVLSEEWMAICLPVLGLNIHVIGK